MGAEMELETVDDMVTDGLDVDVDEGASASLDFIAVESFKKRPARYNRFFPQAGYFTTRTSTSTATEKKAKKPLFKKCTIRFHHQ